MQATPYVTCYIITLGMQMLNTWHGMAPCASCVQCSVCSPDQFQLLFLVVTFAKASVVLVVLRLSSKSKPIPQKARDYDRVKKLMYEAFHYFAILAGLSQIHRHEASYVRYVTPKCLCRVIERNMLLDSSNVCTSRSTLMGAQFSL